MLLAILGHLTSAIRADELAPSIPPQIDLKSHLLAVYTLDDVALEGIHGLEVLDFQTTFKAALRGRVTLKITEFRSAILKESLRKMIWKEPNIVDLLRPDLEQLVGDSCPAIRTELASLCYAIAFTEESRQVATELFLQLVTVALPDEHVLSSYWPSEFIRAGLTSEWTRFQPILAEMTGSDSSEVRESAARLLCIAGVLGFDAIALADSCVESGDPNVRLACAEVLIRNLGAQSDDSWVVTKVLNLANDRDNKVCSEISFGLRRCCDLDLSLRSEFLAQYSRTRAFLLGTGWFLEAIVESNSTIPEVVFGLVESFLDRMNEPREENSDHPSWYLREVSGVLTRLYHENRDGALRARALNLIDRLCVRGGVSLDSLDQ